MKTLGDELYRQLGGEAKQRLVMTPPPKMVRYGIHEILQTLRELGTSQREISKTLGVPRSSIGDWLRGQANPSGPKATAFVNRFNELQHEIKMKRWEAGTKVTSPWPGGTIEIRGERVEDGSARTVSLVAGSVNGIASGTADKLIEAFKDGAGPEGLGELLIAQTRNAFYKQYLTTAQYPARNTGGATGEHDQIDGITYGFQVA